MKLNDKLLQGKTLEEKKNYLEKYRTLLSRQICDITMEISEIESQLHLQNIDKIVNDRVASISKDRKKQARTDQISTEEYEDVLYELERYPEVIESIQANFNIDSISELKKTDLPYVKNKIRSLKRQHENRD